jgi:hypothetical protein
MRKGSKIFSVVAVVVLVGLVLVAGPYRGARAAVPNKSLLFFRYNDGLVASGVLSGGTWTQRQTFFMDKSRNFTHVAVSRDSVMFYSNITGEVESGYLKDGYYTPILRNNLGAGYDILTASCDSYLLYRMETGHVSARAQTGYLYGGFAVANRYYDNPYPRWGSISASCDTVVFYSATTENRYGYGYESSGWLVDGQYVEKMPVTGGYWTSSTNASVLPPPLASTADSYFVYFGYDCDSSCGNYKGAWGVENGGSVGQTGLTNTFGGWQFFAGTADSIIGYSYKRGTAMTATLVNGQYRYVRQYQFWPGWTAVAGGK